MARSPRGKARAALTRVRPGAPRPSSVFETLLVEALRPEVRAALTVLTECLVVPVLRALAAASAAPPPPVLAIRTDKGVSRPLALDWTALYPDRATPPSCAHGKASPPRRAPVPPSPPSIIVPAPPDLDRREPLKDAN